MKRIACLFLIAVCCYAQGPHGKVSKDAADAVSNGGTAMHVIVQWTTAPGQKQHDKVQAQGGRLKVVHSLINAASYDLPASALTNLANDPEVAYVSLDRPVAGSLDLTAAAVNANYALTQNINGTGVTVAVIDSGMNATPDLTRNNQVVYNQDFTGEITPNANLKDTHNAPDLYGHGEHVAGIIASSGVSSSCSGCTRLLQGMAPGVRLVNLRVLDKNGVGSDSTVIAAIQQAIKLKSQYNIRVINLSLGRAVYESYKLDPLCQAVEQAWKAGIVVVVAAGNNGRDNSFGNQGYGTIGAPGNDPFVITVGAMKTLGTAMRSDDLIASYSSKGPAQVDFVVKPDLVAPGNRVVSLLASTTALLVASNPANNVPVSYYKLTSSTTPSNVYFSLSGTSMATPVVSGAAADLLQVNPALTPDQIKALLMKTAYKTFPSSSTAYDAVTGQAYLSYYDIFTVGAGYLDLQAALQNIFSVPAGANAMSPTALYNATTGQVDLSLDASSIWATKAVWATQAVWGSSVLSGTKAVWSTSSIWGATSVSSTTTIWGTKAIWGKTAMSASTTQTGAESSAIAINGEQ